MEMRVMELRTRLVVVDLDGTLALSEHRQHFVERPVGEKDWRSFFDACDKDTLNWPVLAVMLALRAIGCDVQIWSGRTDRVRSKTERWLAENGVTGFPMKMRAEGDHRPDTVLKAEWLAEASQKPMLTIDDRDSVVAMWRDAGIVCFQVADGAF